MTVSGHWESVKFWYCPTWTTWLAPFITAYTLWMEAFTMWVHLLVIIYYHYYCYCHFCTVLMAGFWVLHSSTPFSPFLLHSLFHPFPFSKQLLPFLNISKHVTHVSLMAPKHLIGRDWPLFGGPGHHFAVIERRWMGHRAVYRSQLA